MDLLEQLPIVNMNFSNFSHETDREIDIGQSELPERQWTDYAEITFLVLMLLVGIPLNVLSIGRSLNWAKRGNGRKGNKSGARKTGIVSAAIRTKLLQSHRSTGSLRGARNTTVSQFKSLQIHLTVANLMIICVYGLSQICWLLTIQWFGGDLGCRLVKFLHTFCFYATSNMIAMIAIDRLCVTIYIDRQRVRSRAVGCLRAATLLAWLLACGSSLPQAFFWRAYAPFPDVPSWHQCVTVWVADRHRASLEYHFGFVEDITGVGNGSSPQKQLPPDEPTFYEDLYGGVHLALVFWFPALIVICSYGVIVGKFHKKISQTNRETVRRRHCNREKDAAQFRQRMMAKCHKVGSVSEDDSAPTTENAISKSKCESGTESNDQSTINLLALPVVLQSSQAMAMRRVSRDVAINTLTRAKRTTLRKTMWILLVWILTWSPYNILELWRYFDTTFENSYLEFLSNLIVLNAVLNPLIYSI